MLIVGTVKVRGLRMRRQPLENRVKIRIQTPDVHYHHHHHHHHRRRHRRRRRRCNHPQCSWYQHGMVRMKQCKFMQGRESIAMAPPVPSLTAPAPPQGVPARSSSHQRLLIFSRMMMTTQQLVSSTLPAICLSHIFSVLFWISNSSLYLCLASSMKPTVSTGYEKPLPGYFYAKAVFIGSRQFFPRSRWIFFSNQSLLQFLLCCSKMISSIV